MIKWKKGTGENVAREGEEVQVHSNLAGSAESERKGKAFQPKQQEIATKSSKSATDI